MEIRVINCIQRSYFGRHAWRPYHRGGEEVGVVGGRAVLEFLKEAVEGVGAVEACATARRRHGGAMDDEVAERR